MTPTIGETAVPRPSTTVSTYVPAPPVVDMSARLAAAQLAAARARGAAAGSGDSASKGKVGALGTPAPAVAAPTTPTNTKPNARMVVGPNGLPQTIDLNPKPGGGRFRSNY